MRTRDVIVAIGFMHRDGPQKYNAGRMDRGAKGKGDKISLCFLLQPADVKSMDMTLMQTERM